MCWLFLGQKFSTSNLFSGITIATDDVITTTDDVITTTDIVIHIICIDLEGKPMCWLFLGQNSPLQIYFLELYMEILMKHY